METRLSIDQAALALGLSRPTVKRRLKSGALRGVQERTASGFKWFVAGGPAWGLRWEPRRVPRWGPT